MTRALAVSAVLIGIALVLAVVTWGWLIASEAESDFKLRRAHPARATHGPLGRAVYDRVYLRLLREKRKLSLLARATKGRL